jgi:hypothetical protein
MWRGVALMGKLTALYRRREGVAAPLGGAFQDTPPPAQEPHARALIDILAVARPFSIASSAFCAWEEAEDLARETTARQRCR